MSSRSIQNKTDENRMPIPPFPHFDLPDIVGDVLSPEEIVAMTAQCTAELANSLGCSSAVLLAFSPNDRDLRLVRPFGFSHDSIKHLQFDADEFDQHFAQSSFNRIVLPDSSTLPIPLRNLFDGAVLVLKLSPKPHTETYFVGQLSTKTDSESPEWKLHADRVAVVGELYVELARITYAFQDERKLRQDSRGVAAAILEGKPINDIFSLITEAVSIRLNEPRVAMFLLDTEGNYRPVILRNISERYGEDISSLARFSPIAARARTTGLPIHAKNVDEDMSIRDDIRALYERENIHSLLVMLLHHDEQLYGALIVYPTKDRKFAPSELNAFQSLADMATLGVAITRQMEHQNSLAVLEERNRLAREMHDTVAQTLAALVMQIETSQKCLDTNDFPMAIKMLGTSMMLARRALDDTRRAVHGLAAASLESRSPSQAIADEVQQFEIQESIPAQFVLTGEEAPLSPEQCTTLLRVSQESLANIRKHSQARRVRVGLQYGLREVTLIVEDDGAGFDVGARNEPGPDGGYGLFGMGERVRLVGGEMRIESTPGWGTSVRAVLPYHPASSLSDRPEQRDYKMDGGLSLLSVTHTENRGEDDNPDILSKIRVVIADDHAMIRQGVRSMLELSGEIEIVGEAEDGLQAIGLIRKLLPDVALMDLQMPRMNGQEALQILHKELPHIPVVILTTFQSEASVKDALAEGARGYLLKDAQPSLLIAGVKAAYKGEALMAPEVMESLFELAKGKPESYRTPENELNKREREVLTLLVNGARNKQIASELFISTSTVEYHLSNIYIKLNVSNRTQAATAALELGIGQK